MSKAPTAAQLKKLGRKETVKPVMSVTEVRALTAERERVGLPLPATRQDRAGASAAAGDDVPVEDNEMDTETIEQFEFKGEETDRLALETRIAGARSLGELEGVIPLDYRRDVQTSIARFHSNMVKAHNARSAAEKLRLHQSLHTFPTTFNSLSVPLLQFSAEYNSQAESNDFAAKAGKEIHALKLSLLDKQLLAKEREAVYLEQLSSIDAETLNMRNSFVNRCAILKKNYPGLSIMGGKQVNSPAVVEMFKRVNGNFELVMWSAPHILERVLEIIRYMEDDKLSTALEKMSVQAKAKAQAAKDKVTEDSSAITVEKLKSVLSPMVKEIRKELMSGKGTTGKQSKPRNKGGKGPQASKGSSNHPANLSKKKDKASKAAKKDRYKKKAGKKQGSGGGKSGKA